jgi:hypothetical protein
MANCVSKMRTAKCDKCKKEVNVKDLNALDETEICDKCYKEIYG